MKDNIVKPDDDDGDDDDDDDDYDDDDDNHAMLAQSLLLHSGELHVLTFFGIIHSIQQQLYSLWHL